MVLHALGTGSSGRRAGRLQPGTPPGPDQDPPGAGDAWEPVITRPDPMTEEERQAWLDALDEPFDPEEYPDPDGPPPPGEDELALDVMPGGPDLAMLADAAAGDDDRYPDTSDDELIGVLCAGRRDGVVRALRQGPHQGLLG